MIYADNCYIARKWRGFEKWGGIMIQMFHKASYNLREIAELEPGCWINITTPTPAEVEDISRRLNIPQSMLTDPLDKATL